MKKTFSIKTLGCKLNQYESAQIAGTFTGHGWEARPFGETVDVVIVNTCTVTDTSDRKCRGYIRQGRGFSRSGEVIVTGCMAGEERGKLGSLDGIAGVFSNSEKASIYNAVSGDAGTGTGPVHGSGVETGEELSAPLPLFRTRGFIKVQEGCDNFCSYCIVPSVRGLPRSRDLEEVVLHARRLIDEGFHELVLTGITIGKYRHGGADLTGLLERLVSLEGDFRVRVTSIEPLHVTPGLLEMYRHPKVCRHIHIPLQSGSAWVLKNMNRSYTPHEYREVIDRVRALNPDIAVGTDLIVGFPGETAADFQASLDMMEYAGFASVHCFPFSPREGTPAASREGALALPEMEARVEKREGPGGGAGEKIPLPFSGHRFQVCHGIQEKNRDNQGGDGHLYQD